MSVKSLQGRRLYCMPTFFIVYFAFDKILLENSSTASTTTS